jgi:EAL domain-containing protein (putative c-di-GMP-specific phosphodiesterase class I)
MDWKNQAAVRKNDRNIYIISPCSFAFTGLAGLLSRQDIQVSRIAVDVDNFPEIDGEIPRVESRSRIDVLLTGEVKATLVAIKKLAEMLNYFPKPVPVVIYCRLPSSWLFRMFNTLINDKNKLSTIRLANSSLACQALMSSELPLLETAGRREENISGVNYKGLTPRELEAVLSFYMGISVKYQSDKTGLSGKTIYNHRQVGLRKLQFIQGLYSKGVKGRVYEENSDFSFSNDSVIDLRKVERRYATAIEENQIFPVFQVVTTHEKKLSGFEILLKWHQQGYIQKSRGYLTVLKNRELCLKLMALAINTAVRCINKYNGKYDFSVNIPTKLASDEALARMAKKAVELLHDPLWAQRLIFEFSETIDAAKDKKVPEVMKRLRETGCKLFLDDCFSDGRVMFPVRQIHFDGIKLDRDLVEKSFSSETDSRLLKTILYYCEMTGSICTAEGIDSEQKFTSLVDAGIRQFQGYYLSEPTNEAGVDRIVRQFH